MIEHFWRFAGECVNVTVGIGQLVGMIKIGNFENTASVWNHSEKQTKAPSMQENENTAQKIEWGIVKRRRSV